MPVALTLQSVHVVAYAHFAAVSMPMAYGPSPFCLLVLSTISVAARPYCDYSATISTTTPSNPALPLSLLHPCPIYGYCWRRIPQAARSFPLIPSSQLSPRQTAFSPLFRASTAPSSQPHMVLFSLRFLSPTPTPLFFYRNFCCQ